MKIVKQNVAAASKPAQIRAGYEPAPTKLNGIVRQFKTFSAKRINDLRKSVGIPI